MAKKELPLFFKIIKFIFNAVCFLLGLHTFINNPLHFIAATTGLIFIYYKSDYEERATKSLKDIIDGPLGGRD